MAHFVNPQVHGVSRVEISRVVAYRDEIPPFAHTKIVFFGGDEDSVSLTVFGDPAHLDDALRAACTAFLQTPVPKGGEET